MKRIAAILLVIFGLSACYIARAVLSINGAGASFPEPIYSKWFDEYHKKDPNIQINYQAIGSGGGIRQITEGTVDFGASDGPMNDDQLKTFQDKHGFPVLHFPTVLGADVPTYNIPGVNAELNFTPEALVGIFLGRITKWNDPAISGANKGVNLPGNDIVVVHRSDGSGTTYIWTDYLSKFSEEDCRTDAEGHGDKERYGGGHERAENKRQSAELLEIGVPHRSAKEGKTKFVTRQDGTLPELINNEQSNQHNRSGEQKGDQPGDFVAVPKSIEKRARAR